MSKELASFIDQKVSVLTNDGRVIIGTLRGIDQSTNLIIEECFEKIFKTDEPVGIEHRGLYIARGDNVAVVGDYVEEMDDKNVFAQPLKPIVH
eukprot:TRINITY_DN21352_c0_g1_i1.p1 TRINITY_DN21352_c0_g1~~TRINITY_DN21352_c0_g1_i1.p1  ORF type:complete len:104 (-),score=6.58 TRINITY_DN21352_c0_g1_i1:9-287(-)